MKKKPLHITNGSSLTSYLNELDFKGHFLTWHEMLCEGPTEVKINTDSYLSKRKQFLNEYYDIEIDEYEFKNELHKLDNTDQYSEIILWFEYDLFCHINLVAVISLLIQKKNAVPISLVCSGRIAGEDNLKGLGELSAEQIDQHFKERILLTAEDIEIAKDVWNVYCGQDHNLLKPFITKKSSFQYLGCCLKAHLKRFPDSKSGLSTLEFNILSLLNTYEIKSRHHLLGYALNYQGYYGFGDMQLSRMIDNLSIFITEDNARLILNRKGHEVLLYHRNYALDVNDNMTFGKIDRLDFQFNKQENKLIKTVLNAY
ncbi:DUF1835 domain-containing protein [Ichthyenterobacterium sp. W332]|uniref:DUF1835 domain-containing protein n=1 Tax=Microcosmobacter mediterraneus TaxID=3075607 RepID=A0ABU2YL63_9FLAO|nr:DUF1835 domain-containing protein [Ichthyenterobacterium sp. W332]MDT0558871.1 DUF1835 domain-containing protein [Ichthyenterobacterium sp. W332]